MFQVYKLFCFLNIANWGNYFNREAFMQTDDKFLLDQTWELAKWRNEDWCPDDNYNAPWLSKSTPIIIGGCPRSGSTILRLLIGSHPNVIDGPETHLFLPLPIDNTRLENRFQMPSGSLENLRNTALSRGAFIDGFQKLLLTQSVRSRWVEKTSRNVHIFKWIKERFPFAILLHIIRDPRDVVVSLRTHPRFLRGKSERVATNLENPWSECIDRWKRCIQDGIQLRGYNNYLEVKYESLVSEPEETLSQICAHTGLEFDLSILNTQTRRDKVVGPQSSFVINNLEAGEPLTPNRVGRWRQELPPKILNDLESKLYTLMMLTGYDTESI